MDAIEKRARELLAAEMERSGRKGAANKIRQGRPAMFREELRALIAALTPPEGYVLVPVEMTEGMQRAGAGIVCTDVEEIRQTWAAILAARPEVP